MKRSILLAISALLSGCVVAPGPVYPEPPPPRVEYRGYPPVTSYVWIDGYWRWGGDHHVWVPGRWAPPHYAPRWSAPRLQPLPPPHYERRHEPHRESHRPGPRVDHEHPRAAPRGEGRETRPREGRERDAAERKARRRDKDGADDDRRR